VSTSLRVDAPASRIFSLLAHPADHPRFDGSGMLVSGPEQRISGPGEVFVMDMQNDEMGSYQIANHVVRFEPDHAIAWEPVLHAASTEEDRDGIGETNKVQWGYELEPLDGGTTLVRETYDCAAAPDWLQRAVKNGERWVPSMNASLQKLKELAEGDA
jgi:uncharacterized protein YndB with AHSA1/START domain